MSNAKITKLEDNTEYKERMRSRAEMAERFSRLDKKKKQVIREMRKSQSLAPVISFLDIVRWQNELLTTQLSPEDEEEIL